LLDFFSFCVNNIDVANTDNSEFVIVRPQKEIKMTPKLLILALLLSVGTPGFGQSVDTAWVRSYSCGEYTNAKDIAVDDSGNVYVTGTSCGDYATVKYHPNGDTAWVRRYNGPIGGLDLGNAIAVDGAGNVLVTGVSGYSGGMGPTDDYATIKYYPNGDSAWVRTYNGPGNSIDEAWALTVDNSGNAYVTGSSIDSATYYDYATIKYSLDGEVAWVKRYNGPSSFIDRACAIAVDGFGNAYVTGWSDGIGTDYDYTTVKYDSSGNELWVRRYNGPANSVDEATAIALDGSGNVYVTGFGNCSNAVCDIATLKYDSNGNELWVRRFNGLGNMAVAIAVDCSSSVYMTGKSGYYPDYDYLTLKYDSAGNQLWVRTYNGPGDSWDGASELTLDDSGAVYVTGWSAPDGSDPHDYDYTTIKYDPSGNEICVRRYDGPGNSNDMPFAVAVDDSGYVYVSGGSNGTSYTTIKYYSFVLPGDANSDGKLTLSDVIYLINYLLKGGPAPNPIRAGDTNGDEQITISDPVYLINYLFKGGPPPAC
jgi:hypothetical protein